MVPLDDARQWYRYHHLFADVLRHRLHSAAPDEIRGLHARASAWFEQHGYLDEAVRQALAGQAFTTAARLIEQEALARQARGELATLREWLSQLPDDLLRERPRLGRALLLALVFAGRFREIEPWLAALEQSLGQATMQAEHGVAVPDDPALRVLAGEVAASRALFANLREQTDLSCALSDQALALLPQDHLLIGFAHYSQGASALIDGDVAGAVQALQQAQQECQAVGNLYMLQVTMAYLGQARRLQGRLHDAIASYEQGLGQTPVIEGRPHAQGNGLLVGLGALHYECNDLAAAERALNAGIDLAREEGNALVLGGGLLVLARVRYVQQAPDATRLLLAEATTLLAEHGIAWLWVCGSVAAYQAELSMQLGDVDAAAAVLEAAGRDRPAFLLACDELARVRVLLAQGRADAAQRLLAALLPDAERAGRTDHVITGTALLALAREAQGRHADARALIERALRLAMSGGYFRTFVDMGASLHRLLRTLPAHDDLRPYLAELLAAFPGSQHHMEGAPDKLLRIRMTLAEPLTTRECEVLRLIAAGKSNGEIAAALVVAVSTVKAHINSIFAKLGATSRTQALIRAQELGVL